MAVLSIPEDCECVWYMYIKREKVSRGTGCVPFFPLKVVCVSVYTALHNIMYTTCMYMACSCFGNVAY